LKLKLNGIAQAEDLPAIAGPRERACCVIDLRPWAAATFQDQCAPDRWTSAVLTALTDAGIEGRAGNERD
jgi:hypothetical protein